MFDPAKVQQLLERDPYSMALGVEIVEVGDNQISIGLVVGERHTNFLGLGHGGMVFSLADCALSLASNSEHERALAVDAHIALTAASRPRDRLTAHVTPAGASSKLATYRIEVENQDQRPIALFTGTVYIAVP